MATWYTHINRGVIDSNRIHKTDLPPITIRRGKSGKSFTAHEVELPEKTRIIYSAHDPILNCGARVVIVSESEPKVIR
jgi:hypothetical protein